MDTPMIARTRRQYMLEQLAQDIRKVQDDLLFWKILGSEAGEQLCEAMGGLNAAHRVVKSFEDQNKLGVFG